MANYGLYAKINESSLSSSASELLSKINTSKTDLSSFQRQLTDDIWKANAKQTLLTAFSEIEGEVYSGLEKQLNNVKQIASQISLYKANEKAANTNKKLLTLATAAEQKLKNSFSTIDTTKIQNSIRALKTAINDCERQMEAAENAIKSLCG